MLAALATTIAVDALLFFGRQRRQRRADGSEDEDVSDAATVEDADDDQRIVTEGDEAASLESEELYDLGEVVIQDAPTSELEADEILVAEPAVGSERPA